MEAVIKGKIAKVGRDVDTDQIIAARYLTTTDIEELADHLFEDCPDHPQVGPGTVIAAGENFGSGSSREHAPMAMLGAGIRVVVAESFARIFQRNAINIGLLALTVPGAGSLANGQRLTIDLAAGKITAQDGTELTIAPVPEFINQIIDAGGLIPWIKSGGMS